jgi:hypothetical protein
VRVLVVLTHLRTNLTTRALAAVLYTSQSTLDRIIYHLVPVLARTLRPAPTTATAASPGSSTATLIPVHHHSISAVSKNHRRNVNTQMIICAHSRKVMVTGHCWPGNRNDAVVARATIAQTRTGHHQIFGDCDYRGINTITTPRRHHTGPVIRDHHYRVRRQITARVEHVIAQLKHWQILRQCRRRGQSINHSPQNIARLWNLKTHKQLRVNC